MLCGRTDETAEIDRVLAAARSGQSAALVIRGEAGIGKSALLDYAASRAEGMRVLRGLGIESESELPYAGLHMLLGRAVDRIGTLPDRQAKALAGALGLGDEAGGDRFLVGLAVLTLLAELAVERPLLCLVDDAQWLDQASADALLFAARRLDAEGVAVLLAVREPHAPALYTAGLAELRVAGLDTAEAEALLAEQAGDLSPSDRGEVVAEAQGNPLALLELSAERREGRAYPDAAAPVHNRLQAAFAERIGVLPEATQTLVLVAAAEETGSAVLTLQAAKKLGASAADLQPAEGQRLLRLSGDRVEFGHPLIRSAAYRAAPVGRRIAVHEALAEALGEERADRRAWHLAEAATGPDEQVADLLERTAENARARGGLPAVAAAYQRAAVLSLDPAARTRRSITAARAEADTGRFDRAAMLLEEAGPILDPGQKVAAAWVLGALHDALGEAEAAYETLFEAALAAEPEDAVPLLHFAVQEAWTANNFEGVRRIGEYAVRLAGGSHVSLLAKAVLAANRLDEENAASYIDALRELLGQWECIPEDLRGRILIAHLHLISGDYESTQRLAAELERECRHQGALAVLPRAQVLVASCHLARGRYHDALATATEGQRVAADTCQWYSRLGLSAILAEVAAIQGDEERCRELAAEALELGVAPSSAQAASALSLLDLGYGRYEAALDRLDKALSGAQPMGLVASLPWMVEAAVRLGQPERGARAAALFTEWAEHVGQPWARAAALRCQALLSDEEKKYQLALDEDGLPFDHASTRLLYGEWLRRARRTAEARTQLRAALEDFERLGAKPWAERARAELRATGETRGVDEHAENLLDRLTPQELQVVRLAAQGMSNREIGAQLFLSPRTVGYHLYNAYPKLGVASRGQLGGLELAREAAA